MRFSFRAKVLLAIAAITVSASMAIGWVFLERSRQDIENNYIDALWSAMGVSISAFEENARAAYNQALALGNDPALLRLLASYHEDDMQSVLHLSDYLSARQGVDNIKNIYLYMPAQGQTLTSQDYRAVQQTPDLSRVAAARQAGLSPQLVYDEVDRTPSYMLSYRCAISGVADTPMVSVNLDERRLYYRYLAGIGNAAADSYYLVDRDGVVVSAAAVGEIGRQVAEILPDADALLQQAKDAAVLADGQNRLIAAVRSPMTGYRLIAVSDRAALTASLGRQRTFILGFVALVLLAMLIPSYHMSGRVYAPVKALKDAMQQVSEGDLSARASVLSNDEIGLLGDGFNQMVDQIEKLIGDLVSEKMLKKEAELNALQYQITPHFMYNTLNSIKYAAILQGNTQLGEQLGAFIELLQASISRNGAFIAVRDEVRMVRNYVTLQQFRYENSIHVTYDLSPAAEGCFVPRLLLQPLVENAILHGQNEEDSAHCRIVVSAAKAANMLVLSVQDAGHGMSAEQIHALMQGERVGKHGFSGIGVPNIVQRLRLYYGDKASLKYTSGEYGTKAVILLPATNDPEAYTI